MDWFTKFKSLNLGSLAEYLPQTGLESVSWIEFMKQAKEIISLGTDSKSLTKVKNSFLTQLPPEFHRTLAESPLISLEEISHEDVSVRKFWGEKILQVYFESILKGPYLNLDMRPSGFRFSKRIDDHACAQWVFSRFFGGTDPKFSKSLLLLYRGYYLSRPKDFRQALIDLGLLGSEQDPHELEGLLLDYFGQAGDAPIRFETLKFKQSFFSLFKYLKKNKRKVPSRLIWVGLALAGVYETLELLNAEFNVKDVFHKVDASIG